MSAWDVLTFLGYALVVFVLFSCVFKTHIQRPRMFFWATTVFFGAITCHVIRDLAVPDDFMPSTPPNTPAIVLLGNILTLTSLGCMISSLLMMILACMGTDPAFAKCSNCGYNLTGNNSGTCPECGKKLQQNP